MTFFDSPQKCKKLFKLVPTKKTIFFEQYDAFLEEQWNSINGQKFRQYFESLDSTENLEETLKGLGPWRKGPFTIHDVTIEAEWQSNLKWDRLKEWIGPHLKHKNVIDVGCGNGYYMYRCLEHKPDVVLGIDPSLLFNFQFHTLQKFKPADNLLYLQIGIEQTDLFKQQFDTVLCMGVLYHRRDPIICLKQLKHLLKPSGTLILETLIIKGDGCQILNPEDRYAKMPNVHYIPTPKQLEKDLVSAGFKKPQIVDVTQTSTTEQRATAWSTPDSLENFLDPNDSNLTIEGHPRPLRIIMACEG